ncbi:MAG: hypothetical protein ABH876_00040 [Patescibacteria group bacterium]|nr:hypothetical protein [Patescibacteria group bacterium]
MVCSVCSVGIVVGLGLSRWLKVDDLISGLWVGALFLIISLWTNNLIFKKREKKPIIALLIILLLYWFSTIVFLYKADIINNDCLKMFGLNHLVFGSLSGIIAVSISLLIEKILRKKGNGKALFPYQKVILPIGLLVILSFIFNNICK